MDLAAESSNSLAVRTSLSTSATGLFSSALDLLSVSHDAMLRPPSSTSMFNHVTTATSVSTLLLLPTALVHGDVSVEAASSQPFLPMPTNSSTSQPSSSVLTDSGLLFSLGNCTVNCTSSVFEPEEDGSSLEPIMLLGDVLLGVVLGVLSLLTFVGNAMVLHAVRTEKRLQSVSNMFIVSLAIADLIVGLIVMPINAVYIFTEKWIFGIYICQFFIGVDYTASTASILNLFILSLDRYWSVTTPLKYLRRRTKKRAMIMISVVWVVSSLWVIPIIGWHHFMNHGVRTVANDTCDTEYATNTVLKIITAIFNYYLPLAIMFGLYLRIFMEIRKRSKIELGLRTVGGTSYRVNTNHVDTSGYRGTGSSQTDPDDSNNLDDLDSEQSNQLGDIPEHRSFLPARQSYTRYNSRSGCTENETTETSEDERLYKSNYTNIQLTNSTNKQYENRHRNNTSSSDSEYKTEYFYNETVLDPTTEKLHRFYEEHTRPVLRSPASQWIGDDTAETSFTRCHSNKSEATTAITIPCITLTTTKPNNNSITRILSHCNDTNKSHKSVINGGADKNDVLEKLRPLIDNAKKRRDSTIPGFINYRKTINVNGKTSVIKKNESVTSSRLHKNRPFRFSFTRSPTNPLKKRRRKRTSTSAALSREIKAAKQLGVIMGAFTICFCPYFVLFMVVAFCDGCVSAGLMTTVTWIGYINSTLNPILYPLCNNNFRNKFRLMLGFAPPARAGGFGAPGFTTSQQRSVRGPISRRGHNTSFDGPSSMR